MNRELFEEKIILLLKQAPTQTIKIAEKLGIDRHTLVKYLESMESRGLIKHETKQRAKIWSISHAPVLDILQRKDSAGVQLGDILSSLDEHISIKNKNFETIWKNGKTKGNMTCHESHFNSKNRCANCPVEKTFKTGKEEYLEIRFNNTKGKIITKPIKDDNNQTIAVVEIIKKEKR